MSDQRYLFGDGEIAEYRLRLLADTFAASSRDFLAREAAERPRRVVDLGCGPGYTTALLARELRGVETIGLDSSERFIRAARRSSPTGVTFHCHDVTVVPFPTPPADVLYCRLLLMHLREPAFTVGRWQSQTELGGRLLVEEVDHIDTAYRVFREYLDILDRFMAAQGCQLYLGRGLGALTASGAWRERRSTVARVTPPPTGSRRCSA